MRELTSYQWSDVRSTYDLESRGACRGTELRWSYIRRGKFEMESMLLRLRRGLATTGSVRRRCRIMQHDDNESQIFSVAL